MLRNYVQHSHISFGSCRCEHKCSCFNLIRNHGILCPMKLSHTTDLNNICSCTTDICTHTVQEVCHIYNVWFLGNVLHNGLSLCHCRSHHHIDRCSDAHHIKINMLPYQTLCLCNNLTMLNFNFCTKRTESFQMLIDRSAADITSSRKCNFCMLIFSKQCSQQIVGSSDLLDIIIFNTEISDPSAIDSNRMTVHTLNICSNSCNCI